MQQMNKPIQTGIILCRSKANQDSHWHQWWEYIDGKANVCVKLDFEKPESESSELYVCSILCNCCIMGNANAVTITLSFVFMKTCLCISAVLLVTNK